MKTSCCKSPTVMGAVHSPKAKQTDRGRLGQFGQGNAARGHAGELEAVLPRPQSAMTSRIHRPGWVAHFAWNNRDIGRVISGPGARSSLSRSPYKEGWGAEVPMAELMLCCPMTDRNFSTGIDIDVRSFQSLPDTVSSVHCPRCGRAHW
jgi:hypothetical protein